ncbi:MAG: N-acetyltransferase family protein [Candidatus Saccharibacteria bacterium]
MDINFKEAKFEHLPKLLEIYTYYVLNTTATFHINPPTLSDMQELMFFEEPRYQTFIILISEVICGYVILSQFKKREAYDGTAEVTVYLSQDYIGKGIGGAAIRFIEKAASMSGIHTLIATICGDNNKSIKAFEVNGFTKCAHYKQVGEKFGQLLDVVAYQKIIS